MARMRSAAVALVSALTATSAFTAAISSGCSGSAPVLFIDSGPEVSSDSNSSGESVDTGNDAPGGETSPETDELGDSAGPEGGENSDDMSQAPDVLESGTDSPDGAVTNEGSSDAPIDATPPDCDPDDAPDGCANNCPAGQSAICEVSSDARIFCEFVEFSEAGASLTCGQTATVGTACCGGCGCVAVDLYYDGTYCWQSLFDCAIDADQGKWLDPHSPL